MERNKIVQVIVPALAAAGVVVLVGVLIATSSWGESPATGKGKHDGGEASAGSVAPADMNDSGMTGTLPPLDAPEWKPQSNGMRVWDVKEGEGNACPPEAKILLHYTGWTLDGAVFDTSRGKGAPADFGLTQLIKGWQIGIPGMKPGGIRRLEIPYDLAYGERGNPPKIPQRATLVFEVKLLACR